MTLQAKSVLQGLKKLTNNTERSFSYLYNSTCFCLDDDYNITYDYQKYDNEIEGILTHLASEGYIIPSSSTPSFQLTQKGIHAKQIQLRNIGAFLLHNLIAIIALIVAIITLCNDLGLITLPVIK